MNEMDDRLVGDPVWELFTHPTPGSAQPASRARRYGPWPIVAVLIGYTVSSAVLIGSAFVRDRTYIRRFNPRGALWFGGIGLCHGLAVLSLYAALGYGPLALVSPLAACYPLATLLLSLALLKYEPITSQLVSAVLLTVGGVILLITT